MLPRACAGSARCIIVSGDSQGRALSRRELLASAAALPMWRAFSQLAPVRARGLGALRDARGFVVPAKDADVSQVEILQQWVGVQCRSRLTNRGTRAVAIKEVVLFDVMLDF